MMFATLENGETRGEEKKETRSLDCGEGKGFIWSSLHTKDRSSSREKKKGI